MPRLDRKNLKALVTISVLFFLGTFAWLVISTNLCYFCAASQLWRVSFLAGVPTYLFAFLVIVGSWPIPEIHVPTHGILSLALVAAGTLGLVLGFAPTLIFQSFAQAYDIVYFQSMRLPFASIMIVLLTITLGLVSFNIAVAVREPLKLEKIWTLKSCWARVARNFVMFFGIVVLIHSYVPSSSSTAVFSIMMMSMMLIPLFSFYSWIEKRRRLVSILLGGGVFLSVVEIIPHLTDVLGIMIPLIHLA
jgi:hypothetical protein